MILPIVSHTPAFDASDLPNVSPQLCEASSVVERAKKTGQNVHLLYNTTLTLASVNATTVTSVNARNNWLQKMVMLVITNCANFETGSSHVNGAMYCQVKRPFQVLLFSTPLSLFIAGFLSSIAKASRTFCSFIPAALSITRTLVQSMSCDPFLSRTCSAMADFSGWLSRIASRCSFDRTSRALIVSPTYSSWQVSHLTEYTTSLCVPLGSLSFTLYKPPRVWGR